MKIYSLFTILFGITICLGTVESITEVKKLINYHFPKSTLELDTTSEGEIFFKVNNSIYVYVIEEDI